MLRKAKPTIDHTAIVIPGLSLAAGVLFFGVLFFFASPASALRPLSLVEVHPLDFGTFTVDQGGGSITSRGEITGHITPIDQASEAVIHISGSSNKEVIVEIDSSCTLSNSEGNSMTVKLTGSGTYLLYPHDQIDFIPAAELIVGDNQAPGTYTGTYTITARYLINNPGHEDDRPITGTFRATAAIYQNLTLIESNALHFGAFIVGSRGGTITPDGVTTGDVESLEKGSPSRFLVTGSPDKTVNIEIDPSCTLTSSAGNTMTANLTAGPAVTLGPDSQAVINPTAVLVVSPHQAPGMYAGTYTITVNY